MKTNYSCLLVLFFGLNSIAFKAVVSILPGEPAEVITEEIQERSSDVDYQEYMKNLENEEV